MTWQRTQNKYDYINKPLEKLDPSHVNLVIDGMYRNLCAIASIDYLSKKDVIYLDDSDKFWALADAKRAKDAPDS